MTATIPTIWADDTDASWTFTVTDRAEEDIDWASPVVAIDDGDYEVTGTWEGTAAPSRQIKVPLTGLTVRTHTLYLKVPDGPDITLGQVRVANRS